jgi:hypothetical protein
VHGAEVISTLEHNYRRLRHGVVPKSETSS